jgi:hypothetical protein
MLQFLLICTSVVFMDRAFPPNVYRAAPQLWDGDLRDVYRRYGLVKFPRTALAFATCVAAGLEFMTNIGRWTQGLLVIGVGCAFLMSAAIDTWRARKER